MDYIAEAIEGQYGERCPDFAEGCACCEAWAQYDCLTALEQENKRLREAMEEIVAAKSEIERAGDYARGWNDSRWRLRTIAADALTHEDKT